MLPHCRLVSDVFCYQLFFTQADGDVIDLDSDLGSLDHSAYIQADGKAFDLDPGCQVLKALVT